VPRAEQSAAAARARMRATFSRAAYATTLFAYEIRAAEYARRHVCRCYLFRLLADAATPDYREPRATPPPWLRHIRHMLLLHVYDII